MESVKHFEFTVQPFNVKDFLIKVFPGLTKQDIEITVLPNTITEGLTNTMLKCSWKNQTIQPEAVVVRIQKLQLFMDFTSQKQRTEAQNVQLLHERGCAPQVIATFLNGFCYEYQKGDALTSDRLGQEPICWLIAKELAKIHSTSIDALNKTPTFLERKQQEKFTGTFPKELPDPIKNERLKKELPTIDILLKELELVRQHISNLPDQKIVLCHNDVMAENIVFNEAAGKVSFLDFEALGYNYQSSEIANHFSRFCGYKNVDISKYPTKEFQKKWIRVYLEEYYQQTGKKADDVTEVAVDRLYILSAKYNLFLELFAAISGPSMECMGLPGEGLNFGIENYKKYSRDKEEVLALTAPE